MYIEMMVLNNLLKQAESVGDWEKAREIREKIRRRTEEYKAEMQKLRAEKERKVRKLIVEIVKAKETGDIINVASKVYKLAQIEPRVLNREELWP
jgi:predicted neutral ceramidase superfamily lipid hydrolase